ncbi:MAG TPA: hypothetical protein VK711_17580, partial [Puia sp.]|nr:hypothetical protein [Puia sp.]
GVGGPEAAAIDLIYMYLLQEFGQDIYSRIGINQIDNNLDEFVLKEPGNKIHVNIRYPAYENFESKSVEEKNRIRLDVIHTALLRIADNDGKLDKEKLYAIRLKILENNFSFDFIYRSYPFKKNPDLIGKVIIHPLMDKFIFYTLIENNGEEKCKLPIFIGIPGWYYMDKYFCYGKWKDEFHLIIWGKEKTVETHISIEACTVNIINLTSYNKPPYYTLMKANISEEERKQSNMDWLHSLPPAVAAVLRNAQN